MDDHAQRIADGQQQDLRRLARRYDLLPHVQRQEVLELRRAILTSDQGVRDLAELLPERMAYLATVVDSQTLVAIGPSGNSDLPGPAVEWTTSHTA